MCYTLVSNALENCKSKGALARLCLQTMAHISRDGEYWEAASKLAERCGATARGVQKALAKLVEAGDIEVVQRGGGRRTTRYRLTAALIGDDREDRPGCPAKEKIQRSEPRTEFAAELHQSSQQQRTVDVAATNRVRTNKKEQEIKKEIPTSSEPAGPPSNSKILFDEARRILPDLGVPSRQVGGLVGQWRNQLKAIGRAETDLLEILRSAEAQSVSEPRAWVPRAIEARAKPKRKNVVYIQGVAVEA